MIEGNSPLSEVALAGGAGFAQRLQGEELRAFDWAELVARIRAAQDLRAIWCSDSQFGTASFSGVAAGSFSRGSHRDPDSKPPVNRDALGHRKPVSGKENAAAADAVRGDRES